MPRSDLYQRQSVTEAVEVARLKDHHNAFGFLRLFLASLVIVSHTPELADGNRSRELLTRFFGTISFGEVAVDGFFLISGYLIFGSFAKNPNILSYFARRVARIYPAFIAASLICLFLVAPLGGGNFQDIVHSLPISLWHIAVLQMPVAQNIFLNSYYPQLDSSMWTIRYEFFCYLLVVPLALFGLSDKPSVVSTIAICFLIIFCVIIYNSNINTANKLYLVEIIPHSFDKIFKFSGIFLIGSVYFIYRNVMRFSTTGVLISCVGLAATLFSPVIAELGMAIFGGYLIFAIARWGGSGIISRINNRNDISYGVYLYAWPIEKLLMWYWPDVSLIVAGLCTLVLSCLCGWISWHALEKPALAVLIGNRFR